MKNTIVVVFAILCSIGVNSQIKTVTGIVTDETKLPVPGVNVIVKGTNKGAVADFDGAYTIKVSNEDVLVFSYLGYVTKEVKVENAITIDVQLEADTATLDEVVVVGYATVKKRSITGAVSSVNAEYIRSPSKKEKREAYKQSIANALQGQVAGVSITSVANTASIAQINEKEPLYIVDGQPMKTYNNAVLAKMNSQNIKKMKIHKPAKAEQLFGEAAKNGCVVITTKKGNYQLENDENYAKITENNFEKVAINPLSTFSIDVDKAGYSNIRRLINNGQEVPISAVKVEEMINYFDYEYPQPAEHPFSINTELAKTPWNTDTKLIRIGLQGKEYANEELPASNLTFLIDVSGSMSNQNKLPLIKSAFKLLVAQLRKKDKVAIVVYAGAAGVVLEPTSGEQKEKIIAALDNLEAGGSTAGGEGIELAYDLAIKNFKKNGNNRVILATDGDFNVGASSNMAMEELIIEKRKSGVFLSALGFGMGNYKDSKLEILADKGNGNHAYIDNMQEAQKVFGKEFGGTLYTIAKDVKIQVEFNPAKVQAYRLIGYENRLLADEDFVDDTKDAGELGSGHTVTALYEIVPVGVKSDYVKNISDLKYTKKQVVNTNYTDEWLTVKFRYKKPEGTKSIELVEVLKTEDELMSSDFKFAASVALFGMQLRKSKYINATNTTKVLELAEEGRGIDKEGYRAEFMRLVKSVGNSL